jgi:hypothetical protein
MKALAILSACLVLAAAPASAFGHGGPHVVPIGPGLHGGGPHGGGPHGGGHHGGFLSPFLGVGGIYPPAAEVVAEPPLVIPAPAAAISVSAAPACGPAAAAAPADPSGPHIIYIGRQPEVHGPKVIYGTD